jgi:hypothetical protein
MADNATVVAPAAPVVEQKPTLEVPKITVTAQPTREERLARAVAAAGIKPAEPAAPEVAKPEDKKVEEKPEEKRKAADFAAAAQREKEWRIKEDRRKAEWDARESKLKEREARFEAIEKALANADKDPTAWMKLGNVSYDKLTQHLITGGKLTPEDALKAADDKIEAYKAEQKRQMDELIQKEQQNIQAQQQKLRDRFHDACLEFPKGADDKFELVQTWPGTGEYIHEVIITDLIEGRKTNPQHQPMSLESAAEKVETWLEEQVKLLGKTKKMSGKVVVPEPERPAAPVVHEVRTLGRGATASSPTKSTGAQHQSKAERIAAAIAATKQKGLMK